MGDPYDNSRIINKNTGVNTTLSCSCRSWRSGFLVLYLLLSIIVGEQPVQGYGEEHDNVEIATCISPRNDNDTANASSACFDSDGTNAGSLDHGINVASPAQEVPDDVDLTSTSCSNSSDKYEEGGHQDVVEDASDDDVDLGVDQNLDGEDWDLETEDIELMIAKTRQYVLNADMSPAARAECVGHHENCAIWRLAGECTKNPSYMDENCAPYCRACEERCYYKETGPDSWKEPGDLDKAFRRIVSWTPAELDSTTHGDNDDDNDKRAVQVLSSPDDEDEGPWIIVIDNFISTDEAERFIELGSKNGYNRSETVEGVTDIRTSTQTWCSEESSCKNDPIVQRVSRRIFDLVGIDEIYTEDIQLLKYEEGQYYEQHNDYIFLDELTAEPRQEGNRILTAFLYLNVVEDGGGTTFPRLNLTVVPEVGKLVVWPSALDESPTEIDERTDHQAEKVLKGVKYGANFWFHTRPFQLAYSDPVCKDDEIENEDTILQTPPEDWPFQLAYSDPVCKDDEIEYEDTILETPTED